MHFFQFVHSVLYPNFNVLYSYLKIPLNSYHGENQKGKWLTRIVSILFLLESHLFIFFSFFLFCFFLSPFFSLSCFGISLLNINISKYSFYISIAFVTIVLLRYYRAHHHYHFCYNIFFSQIIYCLYYHCFYYLLH